MAQPVLPGTLELLALKAVSLGAEHGLGLLQRIQRSSGDVLLVEQGALYPALHRLEAQGLVRCEWGVSDNNRRAKYYAITAAGRRRLGEDMRQWRQLVEAMEAVLGADAGSLRA